MEFKIKVSLRGSILVQIYANLNADSNLLPAEPPSHLALLISACSITHLFVSGLDLHVFTSNLHTPIYTSDHKLWSENVLWLAFELGV